MKNYLFFFITFFFTFISCHNEKNFDLENSYQELFFAEKLSGSEYSNLSGYYEQNEIFLKGKFKIIKYTANQLIFYTSTENSKHFFILNGIQNFDDIISDLEIEKLYYLRDGIILNDKIYLGVNKIKNTQLQEDIYKLSNNVKLSENTSSNMLVHKWVSNTDNDFGFQAMNDLINYLVRHPVDQGGGSSGTNDEKCDSGGEGSISCSLGGGASGCSVSCQSGYYACCILTGMGTNDCHCRKYED